MTSGPSLGLVHRFEPGDPGLPVLLLLHGTGGNEHDLVPLGQALLPGAALLSPRGAVLEHGQPRFFRRLAEGVFDQEDLRLRTGELAQFIRDAAAAYGLEGRPIVAIGFSNGANIAASLLLSGAGVLSGAILLRAMVPFEPAQLPVLTDVPVLLSAGRNDPIVPPALTERLAVLLAQAGARLELTWQPAGHSLTKGDLENAVNWLSRTQFGLSSLAG